jgi:hypothetical protein
MISPTYERTVPCPHDLAPTCTDEELLAWVKRCYFTHEELAEAEQLLEARGYEEAIAYLASVGQESLRNSGEAQAPHIYITIPGGKLFILRPDRSIGAWDRAFAFGIGEFARLVFPQRAGGGAQPSAQQSIPRSAPGMSTLWGNLDSSELPLPAVPSTHSAQKKVITRPKKLRYDEQQVHIGTGKFWRTTTGWVLRDRGLAYVIDPWQSGGGYEVSVVHTRSKRVMACFAIPRVDELAHTRIRQLMEVVVTLTDWNRGIKDILSEKQGARKQWQWSSQILDIWWRLEREALFSLHEEPTLSTAPADE